MASTSLTTARPAGDTPRRRTRTPKAPPEGAGAAEDRAGEAVQPPGAAEPGDRSCRAYTTYTEAAPGAAEADHEKAPAAENAAPAAADPAPSGLRLWLARARTLGLTVPQLVFELHARQGLPLLAVAHVLGLSLETVHAHWRQGRTARAAQAPQSEADYALVREHLSAVLWQTVEATYPDPTLEEDADAGPPAPPTAPMLSVRLKALDQIAKLYDLSLEQRAADGGPLPYATPEEIAESVRERVLEMHLRNDE